MGVGRRLITAVFGSADASKKEVSEPSLQPPPTFASRGSAATPPFSVIAGLPDVLKDTNKLRKDANYDNEFDIYDAMIRLDPELNGDVPFNHEWFVDDGVNVEPELGMRPFISKQLMLDTIILALAGRRLS